MTKRILSFSFVVAILAALLLAQPVAAQEGGGRVQFGGNIVVAQDERLSGNVVAIGGSVTVDGMVDGDVTAVGGRVTVTGQVRGDVAAVGGDVVLQSAARVSGAATAVGGEVQRSPGAEVGGDITSVPFVPGLFPFAVILGIVQGISLLVTLLLAAILSVAIFPTQVQVVERTMEQAPWASIGVGLLTFVLLVVLAIPLIFTIIGLPLALLGFLVAALFGSAALGALLGRRILSAFRAGPTTHIVAAIAGILIIWVISLIPILGGLFLFVATLFAVGAVALSRFGTIAPPFSWQGPRPSPPPSQG